MQEESLGFRTSLVGGFSREDVLQYIENAAKETERVKAQLEQLQKKCNEQQDEVEALQTESHALKGKNAELLERMGELTLDAEKSRDEVSQCRTRESASASDYAALNDRLHNITIENESLHEKVAELTVYVDRYNADKEHLAEIELQAFHRAKDIEAHAHERVSEVDAQSSRILQATRDAMQDITNDWRRNIETASAFAKRQDALARDLLARMDESIHMLQNMITEDPDVPQDERPTMSDVLALIQQDNIGTQSEGDLPNGTLQIND